MWTLCSHGKAALCAWDLRRMTFPVHEERLDHGCENVPWRLLPPRGASEGQGLFLTCHQDFILGQASNGAQP